MTPSFDGLCGSVVLATHNKGKLQEFKALFREHFPCLDPEGLPDGFELPKEEGASYFENALIKARCAGERLKRVALADDSGLEVQALSGRPGVLSARLGGDDLLDTQRVQQLLKDLKGVPTYKREARFVCCLVLFDPMDGKVLSFQGTLEGRILEKPVGRSGFGYDPVFWVPKLGKTLAEISPQEKNLISHRFKAFMQMIAYIKGLKPKDGA